MTNTSTCELHDTDQGGCRHSSTCVLHDTDRERVLRGVSSGSARRTALRWKMDESLDTVLTRVVSVLTRGMWRGFGGICRNQATGSILWGVYPVRGDMGSVPPVPLRGYW